MIIDDYKSVFYDIATDRLFVHYRREDELPFLRRHFSHWGWKNIVYIGEL